MAAGSSFDEINMAVGVQGEDDSQNIIDDFSGGCPTASLGRLDAHPIEGAFYSDEQKDDENRLQSRNSIRRTVRKMRIRFKRIHTE